jgi:hypothetical protein
MLNRGVKWNERRALLEAEVGNENRGLPQNNDRIYIVIRVIDSKEGGERRSTKLVSRVE